MKQKDLKQCDNLSKLEVDAQVSLMMEELKDNALSGIAAILATLDSGRITLNKRFKGLYFDSLELRDNKVYANYRVEGAERYSLLETFDGWIIVRIAIRIYSTWQAMVTNGILDNEKKYKERNYGI